MEATSEAKREQAADRQRRWVAANPQRHAEQVAAWKAAHPGKAAEYSAKYRAVRPRAPRLLAARRLNYRTNYGIELEDVECLITAQGGRCPICQSDLILGGRDGAHVDHNHRTGELRGVLCSNCNAGIGQLHDDPDLLRAAIVYLEANP